MTTLTLTGFTARNTEKAVAFTASSENNQKPLWIPLSKIVSSTEGDTFSVPQTYAGEGVTRNAFPVQLEVDAEWLAKVAPHYIPKGGAA